MTLGSYENAITYATQGLPFKGYQDTVTGKWEMAIKSFADTTWRRLLAGIALRNDLTNKQLVTDDWTYIINLFTGNSQTLDGNGVPVVQRGMTSMGAYQTPILVNG
jgi:hypothetical protein